MTSSDVKILEASVKPPLCGVLNARRLPALPKCSGAFPLLGRGAKTKASLNLNDPWESVSRKTKVNEVPQGVIGLDPLPALEEDDVPQYPAVVQGARNNMIKFKDCVVLTRVGSFYEVLHSWNLHFTLSDAFHSCILSMQSNMLRYSI